MARTLPSSSQTRRRASSCPFFRWPGSRSAAGVAICLLASVALSGPGAAAPIDDARAKAAQIERQLAIQGRQVSILAERYNQSRLRVAGVEAAVARTSGELARSNERMAQVRRRLTQTAVTAYVSGGTVSDVARLTQGGSQLVTRRQYLDFAAGDQRKVMGDLLAARQDLTAIQNRLGADRRAARVVEAEAAASRQAALAAESSQRRVLAGVKGDLTRLVAEESTRREAEANRRAEAARQAAIGNAPRPAPLADGTLSRPAPTPLKGSPPPAAGAPVAGRVALVIEEARRQLGKPYVWGGAGPNNYDCSGLTGWAWRAGGVRLSHSAYIQYTETARVSVDQVQPGDLLFFGPNPRGIHHNALYIGNGQMIEASQSGTPVRIRGWRSVDLIGIGRPG